MTHYVYTDTSGNEEWFAGVVLFADNEIIKDKRVKLNVMDLGSNYAEILSIIEGIILAEEMHINKYFLYSDCQSAVKLILGNIKTKDRLTTALVNYCRSKLKEVNAKIVHIPRKYNVADLRARIADEKWRYHILKGEDKRGNKRRVYHRDYYRQ